ncbi:Uma2 family endonuclease [Streptomyces zagrosensis]|uniref:Uma2 family endonuclease n=1 Tax=Streptomyces zagrosensis TaxID=1042984 RepID=A0A7W9V0I7_9ACTN|nr:Uma2 family endonuclease [Streptomyces zagrosensis]MBB5938175.1 Uma2 family endonuclease [Streptomyces zagrosensis]
MSAAAVEPPCDGASDLLREAERLTAKLPGYRVEIIGGELTVTPPPDGPHGEVLTDLLLAFAPVHRGPTRVIQGIGLWLPDGPDDYAVPDLSVVDADYRDHLTEANCYDPAVFHLVLEVTSANYGNDLRKKVAAYAIAKVPVYVIVDRIHDRLHLLRNPVANEYDEHRVLAPGQHATLPVPAGAEIVLDVAAVLGAARP